MPAGRRNGPTGYPYHCSGFAVVNDRHSAYFAFSVFVIAVAWVVVAGP